MRRENLLALAICSAFLIFGFRLANDPKPTIISSDPEVPKIHFMDVGQGDAILFEKGEEQLLVDGGPNSDVLNYLGQVMPAQDKKIERIIVTHPHADHLRGINEVLKFYEVGEVYYNGVSYNSPDFEEFIRLIRNKNTPLRRLYLGKDLAFLDVNIKVLWPPSDISGIKDLNNSSLILNFVYGDSEIVLPGDAGSDTELEATKELSNIDILKISHHGSKTGTSKQLLEQLNPSYCVIMVGKNSYGHPAPSILNLLTPYKVLRTDQDPSIVFGITRDGVILY